MGTLTLHTCDSCDRAHHPDDLITMLLTDGGTAYITLPGGRKTRAFEVQPTEVEICSPECGAAAVKSHREGA